MTKQSNLSMTQVIMAKMKESDSAKKLHCKTQLELDFKKYKTLRNSVKYMTAEIHKQNTRKLWNDLSHLKVKTAEKYTIPPFLQYSDKSNSCFINSSQILQQTALDDTGNRNIQYSYKYGKTLYILLCSCYNDYNKYVNKYSSFPEMWKLSKIKPIAKVKHPVGYKDSRLINILPVISKFLEKVIHA
ncbi:hypothetical protein PR048_010182 [Dryococelus australis]|uniref:Uncharacterized protein n=1 Tax=Dryococelus australis TaxID=614101 RepID=A0ABQ9I212_9NEOP|nr:hypothetical protein PR048_010182 [Dryococelus australis]